MVGRSKVLTIFHSLTKRVLYFLLQDMEKNARPLQEVHDRDISIFRPKPHKHY